MLKTANQKKGNSKVYSLIIIGGILLMSALFFAYAISKNVNDQHTQQTADWTKMKGHDAYADISSDDIQFADSEADTLWDLTNPYYFYETSPIAALVHIDSIDGGRNYSPISEQYTYPETVGKMTVLEVYKGDIKLGQKLNYARMGGILTAEQYMKGLSEAERDKINYLNQNKKPAGYVKTMFTGDIDIEVDKNYIVFLLPKSSKDGKYQEYTINGVQYGLREAKGTDANITVLNNDTKKWESLSSVVKLN